MIFYGHEVCTHQRLESSKVRKLSSG